MKEWIATVLVVALIVALGITLSCTSKNAFAGPYGGDLVPHEGGAVNAEEMRGVEAFLQGLHPFADQINFIAEVQFSVRAAGGDVVDTINGDHPHLTAHFYGDALQIGFRRGRRSGRLLAVGLLKRK